MIRFMLPFVLLVTSLPALAQDHSSPDFAWALRGGGEGNDKIRGMAADADGSVFATGEISGNADFGAAKLTSAGELDFVVAKIDPSGEVIWAARAGGAKIDRGYGVSPDGTGGCFVTGHFQSEAIRFGDKELVNAGDYDLFVAHFDADGKATWAIRGGGAGYDYGHGIASDSQGNAVVAGACSGTGDLGAVKVGIGKGRSALLAKVSPAGEVIWGKTAGGTGGNSGHNVAVGPDDAVYLCGLIRGETQFAEGTVTIFPVQAAFVARYEADGAFRWVRDLGQASNGLVTGVAADAGGRVYLSGMFQGTVTLGETSFTSRGGHDFFAAALDAGGNPLWLHAGGGVGTDYGLGITSLPDGRGCAVTGEISDSGEFAGRRVTCAGMRDAHITVIAPGGEVREFTLAGGEDHDLSYAIAAAPDGTLILAGAFRNATRFGTHDLEAKKGNDLFVARRRP